MKIDFKDYGLGSSLYFHNNSSGDNVVYFDGGVYYGVVYFNHVWRFVETFSYRYGIEYKDWKVRVQKLRQLRHTNGLFPTTTLPPDILQIVKQAKESGDTKYAYLLRGGV